MIFFCRKEKSNQIKKTFFLHLTRQIIIWMMRTKKKLPFIIGESSSKDKKQKKTKKKKKKKKERYNEKIEEKIKVDQKKANLAY